MQVKGGEVGPKENGGDGVVTPGMLGVPGVGVVTPGVLGVPGVVTIGGLTIGVVGEVPLPGVGVVGVVGDGVEVGGAWWYPPPPLGVDGLVR